MSQFVKPDTSSAIWFFLSNVHNLDHKRAVTDQISGDEANIYRGELIDFGYDYLFY